MKNIPIIFAIDSNVVMQCGVTITSLLQNAKQDTFYDIYILCNGTLIENDRRSLSDSFHYLADKCSISFVDVGDEFATLNMEGKRITVATYYRLLIPQLFPQYDKVIYADIDMIFQQDLSDLYALPFNNNELVAAARDLAIDDKYYFESPLPGSVGCTVKDYFNAGFLLMNLTGMREERVLSALNDHAKKSYSQNDQDVLNIVCKNRVIFLPSLYNFQLSHYANYCWGRKYIEIDFSQMFKCGTLHYTGPHKPWNSLQSIAADSWWHYYKQSPFYKDAFYFQRQYNQIECSRRDVKKYSVGKLLVQILVRIKKQIKNLISK